MRVAVNSATSALHIACLALGLGRGDVLWTTANTFVASANCARYCGADVDFVDIDHSTYNMSVSALEEKLKVSRKNNTLPKILVVVHFAGQPCDMVSIFNLSKHYGFKIIEDASHALGASYIVSCEKLGAQRPKSIEVKVGSCYHSHISILSFHPVKIITSGEGGMALTNDPMLAEHMGNLRSHGITTDRNCFDKRSSDEIWNYQQVDLGYNYRMSDIQAALGLNQLSRTDDYVRRRRAIADRYDSSLKNIALVTPSQAQGCLSSFHLYPIQTLTKAKHSQLELYNWLRDNGVAANVHYIPVYLQPYYQRLGFKKGYCPIAEDFYRRAISLPVFPTLSCSEQKIVIELLSKFLKSG